MPANMILGEPDPFADLIDTSFKAQADTAISVVLREIPHSKDLHEVSVCTNAIMAIREIQRTQEAQVYFAPIPGMTKVEPFTFRSDLQQNAVPGAVMQQAKDGMYG